MVSTPRSRFVHRQTSAPVVLVAVAFAVAPCGSAWANGGPFVIRHPSGDSAAKGVLARLMPDLRPGRESVLKVLREDLSIAFGPGDDEGGAGR
jgi:hypothetical protein